MRHLRSDIEDNAESGAGENPMPAGIEDTSDAEVRHGVYRVFESADCVICMNCEALHDVQTRCPAIPEPAGGGDDDDGNSFFTGESRTNTGDADNTIVKVRHELGSDKHGGNEHGSNEHGSNEHGSNEIGSNELGSNEIGSNEIGDDEIGSNEIGSNEIGDDEIGDDEIGDDEIGANEIGDDDDEMIRVDDGGRDDSAADDDDHRESLWWDHLPCCEAVERFYRLSF